MRLQIDTLALRLNSQLFLRTARPVWMDVCSIYKSPRNLISCSSTLNEKQFMVAAISLPFIQGFTFNNILSVLVAGSILHEMNYVLTNLKGIKRH